MNEKFKELIDMYSEKRDIIELERKHVIADLKFQVEEQISGAFTDKKEEPFEVYDEFFRNLYNDTLKIQNEVNEEISQRLENEKNIFVERLNALVKAESEALNNNEIVDEIMDSGIHQVDKLVNNERNPIVEDVVSTMDLEALLDEIKNNI